MGANHAAAAARDPQPLRWGGISGYQSAFKRPQLPKKWGLDTGLKLKSAIPHKKTVRISRGTLPKVQFEPIDNNGTAKTLESNNADTSNFTAPPPTPKALQNDERLMKEVEAGMTGLTVGSSTAPPSPPSTAPPTPTVREDYESLVRGVAHCMKRLTFKSN